MRHVKQHPTGLGVVIASGILVIVNKVGVHFSPDETATLIGAIGATLSIAFPRRIS